MRGALPVFVFVLVPASAFAHTVGLSTGDYRADGRAVVADVTLAQSELLALVPSLDRGRDGVLDERDLAAGHAELTVVSDGIVVRTGARPCRPALESAGLFENDGVLLRLRFRCPKAPGRASLEWPLLARLGVGHRHIATVVPAGEDRPALLYAGGPPVTLRFEASAEWLLYLLPLAGTALVFFPLLARRARDRQQRGRHTPRRAASAPRHAPWHSMSASHGAPPGLGFPQTPAMQRSAQEQPPGTQG